jgi:hypothetical protein
MTPIYIIYCALLLYHTQLVWYSSTRYESIIPVQCTRRVLVVYSCWLLLRTTIYCYLLEAIILNYSIQPLAVAVVCLYRSYQVRVRVHVRVPHRYSGDRLGVHILGIFYGVPVPQNQRRKIKISREIYRNRHSHFSHSLPSAL